jgi:nicotinate-nucleotide--dimethylbenzimidazole phosphoribosyltransferase
MQWVLTGSERMERRPSAPAPAPAAGWVRLKVCYCGVCRTDAKMWRAGHRDLVLPRVPGHEIAARDENGRPFTLWPGTACGSCRYCRSGRENLCDGMQIMGFHFDGGFSRDLLAPAASLIPIPAAMPLHLACLAEPLGCALNALEKLRLRSADRVAVLGGGTVGLLAALAARTMGAVPQVIEKNAAKIDLGAPFLEASHPACRPAAPLPAFDAAITACPDPAAFHQAIELLVGGGRLAFFSGLAPHPPLKNQRFNAVHYKELSIVGAYGLARRHMTAALDIIARHPATCEHLVTSIQPPDTLPDILPRVLAGRAFKYILDFTGA